MQRSETSPDAFIAGLPDGARADIAGLDADISRVMRGHERVLWKGEFWGGSEQRIIGYGEYRYTNSRGKSVEWFAIGLAAQKNYITVFVSAVDNGTYVAESYRDRLGKVKVGRSSVSFKQLADVNRDVLIEMLERARELTPAG